MPLSAAQQLVQLIAQAVTDIEADTSDQIPGAMTTDVNSPIVAPEDELEINPQRRAAMRTLKAATHQLLATLMPAGLQVLELQHSYLQTSALNTVLSARIADLIHSHDPDSIKGGVHIDLLAEKACMDRRKLSHILRFLALRNVFCEIKPNHWANTRCSLPLRTDSPNSVWNFSMHIGEDVALPGLIELPRLLLDKQEDGAFSWDHTQSPFQKYWKPNGTVFEYFASCDDGGKAERFAKGMIEATKTTGAATALKWFDWQKFGPVGTLIDVGGGMGGTAYSLSSYLPGWKVVVQDRAEVIKAGQDKYQKIGSSANMEFEEADFFSHQPPHRVGGADVYFLRHILHDWPMKSCIQILTHLRKAAKPTTHLLVCDISLDPPLLDPSNPILSNGGMATTRSHSLNLTMLTLFNSEERPEEEFREIFEKSGWILQSVTPLATLTDVAIFEGVPNPDWKA